jgi:hypothetical protein
MLLLRKKYEAFEQHINEKLRSTMDEQTHPQRDLRSVPTKPKLPKRRRPSKNAFTFGRNEKADDERISFVII